MDFMDVRYNFTAQFLMGSAMFAVESRGIEEKSNESLTEEIKIYHRALVVSSIIQSVAAIESEISEIILYGPRNSLSSTKRDFEIRDFLRPIFDIIEKKSILEKYDVVLHILKKLPLEKGKQPRQDIETLIGLRNILVHNKSIWGEEMEKKKIFRDLKNLRFAPNPLYPNNVNFFPKKILSSSCACWAVKTVINFINVFYENLGIKCPLEAYSDRLGVPVVIRSK